MLKLRVLFEKTLSAKYISHLDLMNVFRRSFARAKLPIYYTNGFNPHPYFSVALPLPTGFDGMAELLDFDFDTESIPADLIEKLNEKLPTGIKVREVYERVTLPKHVTYASYEVLIHGKGFDAVSVRELFDRDEVKIMKRSKSGEKEVNIIEFIRSIEAEDIEDGVCIRALLCAGSVKTINPECLTSAVLEHSENSRLEYATYKREEIYFENMKIFR